MVSDPCCGPDHEHPVYLHLPCDLRPHDRDLRCDRAGAYPAGDHGQQRVAQHRAELFEVFAGAGFPSVPDYDCRGHLRGADTQHFGRGGHCRGYLGLHGLYRSALFLSMYHTSDRRRTMARMLAALPDMDTEMRQLANSTIAKLEQMTDADFDGQRFDFTGE